MILSATLATPSISEVAGRAQLLEKLGYRRAWIGEGRMRRDAVTAMTLALAATERLEVASGIIPFRTRNITTIAITWKAMYQLAPGRVGLGLGSWWEPISSKAGLHTERPLTAMREVIGALRTILDGEVATVDGEYVSLRGIRFDGDEDIPGIGYDVPIYCAAVGPRMLALGGELADGVLLDFFMSADYLDAARGAVRSAALSAGRPGPVELPYLVACSVNDDDPDGAVERCRLLLARYIAQQPHIGDHCGADPELVDRLRRTVTWPATAAELLAAAQLVPTSLVRRLVACGSTSDAVGRLLELHAPDTELVVCPFGGDAVTTLTRIASALSSEIG